MAKSENMSTKAKALVFIPLVVPSITLIAFALSGYAEGAMMMILVAVVLLLINIAVFFAVLRMLNSSSSSSDPNLDSEN